MVAKYYASNGQGEVPFGWVLKEIEQSDDKITLLDETENQVLTVSKQGLVEISKEDYEKINDLNHQFASVHYVESFELGYEIENVLKNTG